MLPLLTLAVAPLLVRAANDWNVACVGNCSYDLPAKSKSSGTVRISGGSHAVSDLTHAGGWTILGCDTVSQAQDIRVLCSTSRCEHLFEGHGAVDTVVRLSESCSSAPFARVASVSVDSNQTIPSNLAATIVSGSSNYTGTVFLVSVDTDFSKANASVTGPITFSLQGVNFPNATAAAPTRRSFGKRNWTSFNDTSTQALSPIVVDDTFPLYSASISCDDMSASISTEFDLDVNMTVALGVTAAGTVIPPEFTEFALFTELDGKVKGSLDLDVSAHGKFTVDSKTLWSTSIGGIDIPGIFSLGPEFAVVGSLDADITSKLKTKLDLSYKAENAVIAIPSSADVGGFSPAEQGLSVSIVPHLTAVGTLTPHLVPTLKLSLSAFSFVDASAYIDLDASAGLSLNLTADADVAATATTKSTTKTATAAAGASATAAATGCVAADAGLSVNVGVKGSLFDLLKESDSDTLWSGDWSLLDQCWDGETGTITSRSRRTDWEPVWIGRRDNSTALSCPTSTELLADVEPIIEEIVDAFEGVNGTTISVR
ncbi:USP domain-containing protein [Mycena chlorophos]|uniref:USP domain-containing protein n=1 Tax=Mycena chlorophos TaxID=658473 RepID=A0A8H6WJV5_MYCCL|nr:USP domain-containing protein [Mycena chlorophos]